MPSSQPSRYDSKPGVRVQYIRPWPASPQAPWILPDDLIVTPQEAAEYWVYCSGSPASPDQVSEAQCWQFTARKHEFFLDEAIPEAEKLDRARSLMAWHLIACKYSHLGPEQGDERLKTQAWSCMALEAFEIEFLQLLALGEQPKPVPEAVLKEIKEGLQQHLQQQQAILSELRRQRVPLWVQAGKELKLLWPDEICFITSEIKSGLEVFTTSGDRWPCFQTLSTLEQQLAPEPDFMRTSRQHLVNLSHIDQVQPVGRGRDLTFKGLPPDKKARVSDSYLKAFLGRLSGAVPIRADLPDRKAQGLANGQSKG